MLMFLVFLSNSRYRLLRLSLAYLLCWLFFIFFGLKFGPSFSRNLICLCERTCEIKSKRIIEPNWNVIKELSKAEKRFGEENNYVEHIKCSLGFDLPICQCFYTTELIQCYL